MYFDSETSAVSRSPPPATRSGLRSEEHTSELQSQSNLVCRLLLEKKKQNHHLPNTYTAHEHGTIGRCTHRQPIQNRVILSFRRIVLDYATHSRGADRSVLIQRSPR